MLDFSPFRPETNGRNEGAFRTLFRRPFRFGFYPREGSAPPEAPLRCTRGPFAAPRPFAPFAAHVHPPGTGAPLLRATSTRAARDSANTICAPDAALPPSHATPSGLRPISRSAPLYGQRSDGAVECREHRPECWARAGPR